MVNMVSKHVQALGHTPAGIKEGPLYTLFIYYG